jgi:glutamate-1-semialdehyde 2,1-aminomutase
VCLENSSIWNDERHGPRIWRTRSTCRQGERQAVTQADALFRRALGVLPGGASRDTVLRSPHPFYAASAHGYVVTDVDGRQFIDFANNMASLIHGHAFPPIVEAVSKQLRRGTCFTFGTVAEIDFAEHMCSRSPAFEKIRFMNSGTEAVMAAVKAARAFTGRPKIAKIEGAYHGTYDYVEISQAPGPDRWGPHDKPNAVPLAAGTPEGVADDVVVMPFNDPDVAIRILDRHGTSIAGVLIDPIPHRVGLIPVDAAFVRHLRDWTQRSGAVLIFDEVITFRTEVGGAQVRYDVKPDLTALGKAIGGGFPVGAVTGRSDVMAVFAADARGLRLPQSGTFSANPITMTAGLVAMQHFGGEAVARLNHLGELARQSIREAIKLSGVPACATGTGSMFRVHLRAEAPRDYREAFVEGEGKKQLARLVNGLLEQGIMVTNTGAGMLSTVMGEAQIARLADGVLASLRRLA